MHELTELIKKDMTPALGVTEPGAIAFCVAKAKEYVKGELIHLDVAMNSGMYKNAFTCGIPNSDEFGNSFTAALGFVAGDASKGLLSLSNVTKEDNQVAKKLIDDKKISISLSGITSKIYIKATLKTTEGSASVTIRNSHTNITKIEVNGKTEFETDDEKNADEKSADDNSKNILANDSIKNYIDKGNEIHTIHKYTLSEILDYVDTVPVAEIEFVKEAYKVNLLLFEEGLKSERTTFARALKELNGDEIISKNEKDTASLLCNAAIEARVIGLDKPAMSITGSGAHGIIATMPLYAVYKINNLSDEKLYRATMLSYLICTYIKEYSGRLSAFCGCAIAAGTGMACGVAYLKGGKYKELEYVINNMASSITGMICDGGNQGCTMKGIAATDTAFRSVELAMRGVHIDSIHGINGRTPEETMRNMGLIASPGMVGTEKTIVEIFENKNNG